jgi:hypothetical protein
MKTKFKLLAIVTMLLVLPVSLTFASFPVKKSNDELKASEKVIINKENLQQKAEQQLSENAELSKAANASKSDGSDDKVILILLWFFLGIFAAHRWYKKKPVGWNILFILTLGGCGVWAIIDLININKLLWSNLQKRFYWRR